MQRTRLAIVVASALTLVGCYWQITIRTTIAPDGRTERRVSVSGDMAVGVADAFVVPTSRPWAERDVGMDAYTVRGTFGTPATMPSGYARRGEATGETAPSRIEWRREDRVFYTLYEYRETITDIVTADRFDSAADELIDVAVNVACFALEDGLGDTYDVSRLTTWVRKDGEPLLKSLAWTWLVHASAKEGQADWAALRPAVNAMVRRRGLEIDVEHLLGDGLDTEAGKRLMKWLGDRVRLKSAPDRPLNERERAHLDQASMWEGKGKDDAVEAYLAKRYGAKRYGSKEKAEGVKRRLVASVLGAYVNIVGPSFKFRASLVLPGRMLRTNGYLFGPSEAAWRFTGQEVYPFGYVMHATSFVVHEGPQRAVSKTPFIASARQVFGFESMLKSVADEEWGAIRSALRACVKAGSLAPLDEVIRHEGGESGVGKGAAAVKAFIASGGKVEE